MNSEGSWVVSNLENTNYNGCNNGLFSKNIAGKVVFDLGEFDNTSEAVRIRGEFSRIKPNYERQSVTSEQLTSMKSFQRDWLGKFFDVKSKPEYFEEVIDCSCKFNANVYPNRKTDSREMELALQLNVFFWILDDQLENSISQNISSGIVEEGLNRMLLVLKKDDLVFVDSAEYFPRFRGLFASLVNIRQGLEEHVTGYKNKIERLYYLMQRYFNAMVNYPNRSEDGKCSEKIFRNWRKIVCGADTTVECLWTLENCDVLSPQILKSPSFHCLCDAFNGVVAYTNDLLGMKHDFGVGLIDSLLVFKVVETNVPLAEVIEQMCSLINNDLSRYLLTRDLMLTEFSNDPTLVKYLNVLEGLMDGHNRMYTNCKRYLAAGCVKLVNKN